jgi:hypothetical protein
MSSELSDVLIPFAPSFGVLHLGGFAPQIVYSGDGHQEF